MNWIQNNLEYNILFQKAKEKITMKWNGVFKIFFCFIGIYNNRNVCQDMKYNKDYKIAILMLYFFLS